MNIIKLNATDSTNTYLKILASETQIPDGTIVVAEEQEKGRGQRGNGWIARKGQSLTLSIYKRFGQLKVENQFVLSMAVALAIAEGLDKLGVPKIKIKWPNDIMSADKKIGGILIENILEGSNIKQSIIGIGINVNETAFPQLPQASSLRLQMGKEQDLKNVFTLLTNSLVNLLDEISDQDFMKLRLVYEGRLFQKDKISVFENTQGVRFNGIIKGISDSGEIMIETENAASEQYRLKEIKMIY